MPDFSRDDVLKRDAARHKLRRQLRGDADAAKHDLHPMTIASRWTDKQKTRLLGVTGTAKQKVANNAPLIGLAGLGILLFTARKPILKLIGKLRNRRSQNRDVEE